VAAKGTRAKWAVGRYPPPPHTSPSPVKCYADHLGRT